MPDCIRKNRKIWKKSGKIWKNREISGKYSKKIGPV
jgi:hypothetical protein